MNTEIPTTLPVDYTKVDIIVEEIIDTVVSYMTGISREVIEEEINKAYHFARDAHEGQMRNSGDPYIIHPAEAAKIITTLRPDLVTIQSCFLHDVPEDTPVTVAEIEDVFGPDVAHIVSGMEKLSKVRYRGEERNIGSMRKMFIAMSEDLRLILVKFADRIHNMRTLEFHPDPEKRKRIALETLNIYVPIADRLGIFDFKEILETECFRILYPEDFKRITSELSDMKIEQDMFLTKATELLSMICPDNVKIYEISARIKSPYSIFKKMKRKGYEYVSEIYDLFALRIITESIANCYELLGLVHNQYAPSPKRFKDYIALPKPNGYQSLHTTVLGLLPEFRRLPTEIQIRTMTMHRQAEMGVAAHFDYKEKGSSTISRDVFWVQELKALIDKIEDGDFMGEMKTNVFDDRIFVFTPKGEVINLPRDSTPIDFAYAVHSQLGNHLAIAKVNSKVCPLDAVLHNGDRVEIVTDKNRRPSVTWLSFVKTSRAKEVIRSEINREQREILIIKGRMMLSEYLEKHYGKGLDKDMSILKHVDDRVLDTKGKEEILLQVGNLSRKPSVLVRSIMDALSPQHQKEYFPVIKKLELVETESKPIVAEPSSEDLIIGGQKNIPHRFAECCKPQHGDRVVGYATRFGVNIHKVSCTMIKKGSLDRLIPTNWSNIPQQSTKMRLEILVDNRIGVLRKISDIFYMMLINIEEISQKTEGENGALARLYLVVSVDEEDYYLYERLVERMKLGIPEFKEAQLVEII
ncbi:MAG: RelA/SpoT family protein [Candidatus Gracilibacteria bacterium]|nr:RelA/SpoT family protein [Candidatus Gracilibacteria bacterium]